MTRLREIVLATAVCVAGCGEDAEIDAQPGGALESSPEEDAPAAAAATVTPRAVPDVITDRDGKKWKKVRKAVFRDPTPEVEAEQRAAREARAGQESAESKVASMTLEQAAAYLRPRALVADYEYEIDEDGALEFARQVQAQIRDGVRPVGNPSSPPPSHDKNVLAGYGDWTQENDQAHTWPHNMVAAMDDYGYCSAFKIRNDFTALTAAHCLINTDGTFRTPLRIRFGAGSSRTTEGGTGQAQGFLQGGPGTQCYAYRYPSCYPSDSTCDFAVLALRNFGGAWCNHADYDVGWYGWDSTPGTNITTRQGSYPAAPPSGGYPGYWYQDNSGSWGGWTSGGYLYHRNDTKRGSSGSPVYDEFQRVRGVHISLNNSTSNRAVHYSTLMDNYITWYGGW